MSAMLQSISMRRVEAMMADVEATAVLLEEDFHRSSNAVGYARKKSLT